MNNNIVILDKKNSSYQTNLYMVGGGFLPKREECWVTEKILTI